MVEQSFKTLEDLYNRVYPALRIKVRDMKLEKFVFIDEDLLWNYFCQKKWKLAKRITLGEMIDDILNTDNFQIYSEIREGYRHEKH